MRHATATTLCVRLPGLGGDGKRRMTHSRFDRTDNCHSPSLGAMWSGGLCCFHRAQTR
jgi:hypothetical protein